MSLCFLFGVVSSFFGGLGKAALFYCGTSCAIHIVVLLQHVTQTFSICFMTSSPKGNDRSPESQQVTKSKYFVWFSSKRDIVF